MPPSSKAVAEAEAPAAVSAPAPQETRYWVGTTADAPRFSITVGGACFPRETQIGRRDAHGAPLEPIRRTGDILGLEPEQVDRVKKSILNRVVRWMARPKPGAAGQEGRAGKADIYDTSSARYRKHRDDEPLGWYLWMIPEDKMPSGMDALAGATPATFIPRPEAAR